MTVYKFYGKEGYLELQLKNYDTDKELLRLLSEEKSVKDEWKIPELEIVTKGKKTDCPFFWGGTCLAMVSENAKNELKDVWEKDNIELLPLSCGNTIYYLLHIMQTEDTSYDISEDYELVFNKDECEKINILNKYLFRVYSGKYKSSSIFVTEKFIERVKNTNLKGFGFKEIWKE